MLFDVPNIDKELRMAHGETNFGQHSNKYQWKNSTLLLECGIFFVCSIWRQLIRLRRIV